MTHIISVQGNINTSVYAIGGEVATQVSSAIVGAVHSDSLTLTGSIIAAEHIVNGKVIQSGATVSGNILMAGAGDVPYFSGAYEYTPTQTVQTIQIANKMATANIIINPIPNNYGLVTWNGATLTVS